MSKLVFNLGIERESIEAMKPFVWFANAFKKTNEITEIKCKHKDLNMFAEHRGLIIDDNTILSECAKLALNHIERELKEILGAFESKGNTYFKDLKFVYRKTKNQGFVGTILFYRINKPMYLYFEFNDELNSFVGGECVNNGYNKTFATTKTDIYNYLAVHCLMGLFGTEMSINARGDTIFVEYKSGKIYRLDISYKYNRAMFNGIKKGLRGTTLGNWGKVNKWGLENSVELPSFGSYIA